MRISDCSSDVCSSDLFSGVYWDMQDIIPEDVDRIEVISGPGATLWGANAVNGVINIVTRNAGASQGGYVSALGGSKLFDAALRFGERIRSEEHTSELQSLMRISYAVVCWKKTSINTPYTSAGHIS